MSKRANQNSDSDSQSRDTGSPEQSRETVPPRADTGPTKTTTGPNTPPVETFGRYRIMRQLGQGSMGSVYLAQDTELDREVALKIPKFFTHDGPDFKERFYREARAAATLSHPNICAVHDIGEFDGTPYMTMAFIDGVSLSEYVEEKIGTSEPEIAAIIRKLAITLQAAHDKGIIHRDLKPANILVDKNDEPVLMDFGLARQINNKDSVRLTLPGELLGSPAYMSPEQVEGDLDLMGIPADIYSLGVVTYELLAGELPFRGSIAVVIGQIVSNEPKALSEWNPLIDPRLEAICMKMMAKRIEDRYRSMTEVVEALDEYLDSPEPFTETGTIDESLVAELSAGSLAISGCDLARGVAMVGMVFVNYSVALVTLETDVSSPEWLIWLIARFDGRAAALFVLLMGIGFSFLSQRACRTGIFAEVRGVRNRFLIRASLLFVAGYMYSGLWPGDLLHYCGVFLVVGVMLMTASGRVLWTFITLLILLFPGLFIGFEAIGLDYQADWDTSKHEYIGFWTPVGVARNLFFNGVHPVIPWAAFFLTGMWLGRINLRKRQTQYRIFWIAVSLALATELLSALNVMIFNSMVADKPDFDYATIVERFGTTPSPPLPLFMLAAGSTAVAIVAACLIVSGRRVGARMREMFAAAGRMAITLYVAHVLLGMGLMKAMGRLGGQSLIFAVSAAFVFSALMVAFAAVWSRWYRRGPLEWLIRKAGG